MKDLTTENNVLNTREIRRHETDTGSVIKFEQFGETVKLFVPDAKYRSELISFRQQVPDYTVVFTNGGPLITSAEYFPGPKLGQLTAYFNSTDIDDLSLSPIRLRLRLLAISLRLIAVKPLVLVD